MASVTTKQLYSQWLEVWNGNLALAQEIIAPGFVIHQVGAAGPLDPAEFRGPTGLAKLVGMGRGPFADLRFTVEVGPIVDGAMMAARWTGRGTYRGGIPGATAPAGTPISFGGNDLLRVEAGKLVEYWVSSDGLYLMAQLGVIPAS